MTLNHVTVAGNNSTSGAAGLFNSASSLSVGRSIVSAGGLPATECSGTITSTGYNLDEGTTCGFLASEVTDTSAQGVDPELGLFADNNADGLEESLAIAPSSPAADLVASGFCAVGTDIRGYDRPQPAGGDCDAGSYELRTCDGAPFNGPAGAACPVPPVAGPTPIPPAPVAPKPRKCKKPKKLKKGKCVKKKKRKKKKK
jgi:hypothetical protein